MNSFFVIRQYKRNFALVCDRFGVPDRVASALGTALLQDFKIKDKHGKPLIMDKSKVRREKEKCRQEVLRKRLDDTNLLAFSFDGRKDDTLTIHEKYHTRMVKEPHLVILREPNSELIGYVRLEHETAEYKTTKLNGFFNDKNISLDTLIGICTDGEPTNTGPHGGIIRRFELLLKRPLHWFVCLLHFNELPFRHLFEALDKSTSTGPRSATGKLSRPIETCETLPVVDGFQKIELQNMTPAPEKKKNFPPIRSTYKTWPMQFLAAWFRWIWLTSNQGKLYILGGSPRPLDYCDYM
ncbi:uncharacterized protein LOC125779411 [Bactrocera dorsalis]|uniref:Uncharacterized protein LOC125779411 n=1 Tax=Bactrocera dorsalis TaxID=27457 RepID=A0ABM3K5G8_BACDO|nr:uncharacterized protein LOC125779411 [Bactrocera dorsalis]